MKFSTALLVSLWCFSTAAAKFGFDDSDTNVTFRCYIGTNSGSYLTNFPISVLGPTNQFILTNAVMFPGKTNYMVVTAVDSVYLIESDPSN